MWEDKFPIYLCTLYICDWCEEKIFSLNFLSLFTYIYLQKKYSLSYIEVTHIFINIKTAQNWLVLGYFDNYKIHLKSITIIIFIYHTYAIFICIELVEYSIYRGLFYIVSGFLPLASLRTYSPWRPLMNRKVTRASVFGFVLSDWLWLFLKQRHSL